MRRLTQHQATLFAELCASVAGLYVTPLDDDDRRVPAYEAVLVRAARIAADLRNAPSCVGAYVYTDGHLRRCLGCHNTWI